MRVVLSLGTAATPRWRTTRASLGTLLDSGRTGGIPRRSGACDRPCSSVAASVGRTCMLRLTALAFIVVLAGFAQAGPASAQPSSAPPSTLAAAALPVANHVEIVTPILVPRARGELQLNVVHRRTCSVVFFGPDGARSGPFGVFAARAHLKLTWRVPRNVASGRWHARVTCASRSRRAHLWRITVQLFRVRGNRHGRAGIVQFGSLRITSFRAAPPAASKGKPAYLGFGATNPFGALCNCTGFAYSKRPDIYNYASGQCTEPASNDHGACWDGGWWGDNAAAGGELVGDLPEVNALISLKPGVEGAFSPWGHVGWVTWVNRDNPRDFKYEWTSTSECPTVILHVSQLTALANARQHGETFIYGPPGSPTPTVSTAATARGFALTTDGSSGWVADSWGGLHPFGSASAVFSNDGFYFRGRDQVRGIVARNPSSGYDLDLYGGVHGFGGAPTVRYNAGQTLYQRGRDVARGIALRSDGASGYVLDLYGGLHGFGGAPTVFYSDNFYSYASQNQQDLARAVVVLPDGASGYVLDAWGGLHAFGSAPATNYASGQTLYQPGNDIARGLTRNGAGDGGYVLDAWGGIHAWGNAPPVGYNDAGQTLYQQGRDVARAILLRTDTSGYVLDWAGKLHAFGGAPPVATSWSSTAPSP
jgi:hypothetical protein